MENIESEDVKSNKCINYFESLTICDDADNMLPYVDALNFAFAHEDITNIAITGPYGAGKSSVLETYKRKYSSKKFLHISLATFQEEKIFNKNNKLSSEESILEGKILNSLLHQIDADKIPQTKFQVKKKLSEKSVKLNTALVSVLLVCIAILFFNNHIVTFLKNIDIDLIKTILSIIENDWILIIASLIIIITVIRLVYVVIVLQQNRHVLKKLNIGGNEISIFEDAKDSYFNKYLNEILYLFEQAEVDVIIFEDMDRFDNNIIFSKLREINNILQQRKNFRENNSSIRFMYLLRDDVFISKERTKFFDFIIPIVPLLDRSNAYDHFLKKFKKYGLENQFNSNFLQNISLYVDDFRLLTNIINEYQIYHASISTTGQKSNKLLAMIIYKNIFPKDYADLQLGLGFVYAVFEQKQKLKDRLLISIDASLSELEIRLNTAESQLFDDETEYIFSSIKWPSLNFNINNIYMRPDKMTHAEIIELLRTAPSPITYYLPGSGHCQFDYKAEMNRLESNLEFTRNLKAIRDKSLTQHTFVKTSISKLKNEKLRIECLKFHDLITRDNVSEIFNVTNNSESYEFVKSNPYINLLKYLIRDGFIDETYSDYMTYFISESITQNDKVFLRSILDQDALPASYSLDMADKIDSRLSIANYRQPEILNFSLIDYLLNVQGKEQNIKLVVNQLEEESNYTFVSNYFNFTNYPELFIITLNRNWVNFISGSIDNSYYTQDWIQNYIQLTITLIDCDECSKLDEINDLCSYISKSPEFLNFSHDGIEQFKANLSRMKVSFISVNFEKANLELATHIYHNDLYQINFNNILVLLKTYYVVQLEQNYYHANYTVICTNKNSPIYKYVSENLNTYFAINIDASKGQISDDENVVIEVLNLKNITLDLKTKYMSNLIFKINNLEEIEALDIQNLLIESDKVTNTSNNVLTFFTRNGMDETLVRFINKQSIEEKYIEKEIIKEYSEGIIDSFWKAVIVRNDIHTTQYLSILNQLNYNCIKFDLPDMNKDKITGLIDGGVLLLNSDNLKFMRKTYPECIMNFAVKNINDYIELIEKNSDLFELDEMKSLLNQSIPSSYKIKLVGLTSQPISTINLNISTEVLVQIVKSNFDSKDVLYWNKNYNSVPIEAKPILLTQFIKYIDFVISANDITINLLIDLTSSSLLNKSDKYKLITRHLLLCSPQEAITVLSNAELDSFIGLFSKKNPAFIQNSLNKAILDIFIEKRWINKYEISKNDASKYQAFGKSILRV